MGTAGADFEGKNESALGSSEGRVNCNAILTEVNYYHMYRKKAVFIDKITAVDQSYLD